MDMKPKKEQLLYFDAEWTPIADTLEDLKRDNITLYDAWVNRCERWNKEKEANNEKELSPQEYWGTVVSKYPEFIKIICVSFGYFKDGELIVKSSYGHDERAVLEPLTDLFNSVQSKGWLICGAGITRYDMPFISKRMMANGLIPPVNLSVYGQKPWEVKAFDIIEAWGQGCRQESFTPLEWVCVSLGIPSPKVGISGADVRRVYYEEGQSGLERIKTYCEGDVRQTSLVATRILDLMP